MLGSTRLPLGLSPGMLDPSNCSAGPVGLLCMAVAKALGSRRVIAIDVVQEKLDFAKEYAASDVYKSSPAREGESMMEYSQRQAKDIRDTLDVGFESGPESIDLVVDCTGADPCIATGIFLTADGGTFVQVGIRSVFPQIP